MSKNSDIYTLLVEMSEDIGHLKGQGEAILAEAKKTNGRVTKLEEKANKSEISWAKLGTVFSIGLFILVAAFNFFVDWLKATFIK